MNETLPQMIVGSANNVGMYFGTRTVDLQALGGWQIKSLALDPRGTLWCVGTAGNPALWNAQTQSWSGAPDWLGGWSLNCLAWDTSGTLWCVGSAGNLSRWIGDWADNSGRWAGPEDGYPQLASTTPWQMVAFDTQGGMWGVQADGTIVSWSSALNRWQQVGSAPPAATAMVSFSDAMYAVTEDFRTFRSADMSVPQVWTLVPTGWSVRWFGPAGNPGVNVPSAP